MSIHDKIDERTIDKEDQITRYLGNVTLAIDKRFRPPVTDYYSNMYNLEQSFEYDILDNYDFYIRFYFPRSEVVKRVDNKDKDYLHIIVMFNGLDESFDKHYNIYNRLGASFAYHGVASVLLPTPFHLSRAARLREDKERIGIPSERLVQNPWLLPVNFVQSIHEFNLLLRLIRRKFDNIENDSNFKGQKLDIKNPTIDDKDFYRLHFDIKNIDISVLGYSLGGLRALACLKYFSKKMKSCIVLNSGGTLKNLKIGPPIMENIDWQAKVVSPLLDPAKEVKYPKEVSTFKRSKYHAVIHSILFQEENVFDDIKYDKLISKIILVAGGKDRLVEPESIKRLESSAHGLNILQVADLSHFIGDDPQFNRWYDRIITLLVSFFEEVEGELISRNANLSMFLVYDFCCNNKLTKNIKKFTNMRLTELEKIIESEIGEKNKENFTVIIKSMFAYYRTANEFISQYEKLKKNNELLFCQNAARITKSSLGTLEEIIFKSKINKPAGEKLAGAKEILYDQIDLILKDQINKYIETLKQNDTISENWKQVLLPLLEEKKDKLVNKVKGNPITTKRKNPIKLSGGDSKPKKKK